MRAAVLVVFAVACSSRDKPTVVAVPPQPGRPDAAVAAAPTAEIRARQFLQAQIDAALARDEKRLLGTFAPDTIVFTPQAQPPAQVSHFGIGDGAIHASSTGASIAKLAAGGTADAVWFYAEVSVQYEAGEGETTTGSTRVVELITASSQWRAVAGSFTTPRKPRPAADNLEVPNATEEGPLAPLVDADNVLRTHLAKDAIVVGPVDTAWIAGPLKRFGAAREVRTAEWGFVQVAIDRPAGKYVERLNAQLFAIPRGDGWDVVLAQLVAQ